MKQQSIFDCISEDSWSIFVDGASRGNPGPAGAGIVIAKNKKLIAKHGFFLGKKTNNQAEYLSLLLGLFFITETFHIKKNITIFADSELMVKQINGLYRVKNESLFRLFSHAKTILNHIECTIKHIPRSENSYADTMANHGVDTQSPVPQEFIQWVPNTIIY